MKNENGKSRKKEKTNSQKHNKPKGELLEKIVAILYQTPGATVQTNVDYPTTDGKSTREIDILWTFNVAGLKVEYAFQCKNEIKRIGEGKISQFFGDLHDVGIPAKHGIFVAVNGFTKEAIRYAKTHNIKTLVLKGLTKDRLKSEISSAIQHVIHLIPQITELSIINGAPNAEYDFQFAIFRDKNKKPVGIILDLIFNRWQSGKLFEELGEHKIEMDVPINWFQFYRGEVLLPIKISAKVLVLAVVITIDGIAENHFLLDAETEEVEKLRTQVNFQSFSEGDQVPLTWFFSELKLKEFIEKSNINRLTIKSRLPRIISHKFYYPFSKPVADMIFIQIANNSFYANEIAQADYDELLFEVKKDDLFREGIYNCFGEVVSIIVTDNEGSLIDLTLVAKEGDFDKVISLHDRYIENPSKSFESMLAWAYERKSKQLSDKAGQAKINKNELLSKSLEYIEISIAFNSDSISSLKQRVEVLLNLGDYSNALKTINLILTKTNEDTELHLFQVYTLIKLKEWNRALKEIKNTEKLLRTSKNDIKHTQLTIKVYRAEILHGQEKYVQSWSEIVEVWQKSPEQVIMYFGGMNFVIDVLNKVNTIESRWFNIELLYYRAIYFLKIHQYETSDKLIKHSVELLNDIKLLDEMKEEPIFIGTIKDSFVQNVLERIAKLLRSSNNRILAEEQINHITDWFNRTYKKEPTFLS